MLILALAMILSKLTLLELGPAAQAGTAQSAAAQGTSQTPPATDKERAYRVSGVVVDATTGAPLADAQVSLTSNSTQDSEGMLTDETGRFEFEDVPPGKYVLSAKRKGYLEQLYKQHQ